LKELSYTTRIAGSYLDALPFVPGISRFPDPLTRTLPSGYVGTTLVLGAGKHEFPSPHYLPFPSDSDPDPVSSFPVVFRHIARDTVYYLSNTFERINISFLTNYEIYRVDRCTGELIDLKHRLKYFSRQISDDASEPLYDLKSTHTRLRRTHFRLSLGPGVALLIVSPLSFEITVRSFR